MLIFRTDESNFDQDEAGGVRIASGLGLKVDFDEAATDGDTLGLWHLHDGACQGEGTGLADASGGGHDLVSHGAESVEDGYRLVSAEGDHLDASLPGRPEQSQVTVEFWVRAVDVPAGGYRQLACYGRGFSGDDVLQVRVRRGDEGVAGYVQAQLRVGGSNLADARWYGDADLEALLTGEAPWHVAAVLDAPDTLRLFVDGTERAVAASGVVALPAGDYVLRLGRWITGWPGWDLDGVLDEVRLSSAARYAAGFTRHRLLAAGTSAGPTFDAVRLGADWLDLVAEQDEPDGTGLAWEVRASDELDAFGEPQAVWEPWDGDPADLPDGRFGQWRATLTASADRLTSPTLVSVEAHASEAGYDLYHGAGPGPSAIDYAGPLARVGRAVTEAATGPLDAGTVHWFGIRPVDGRGIESPVAQNEVRLELDGDSQPVPDRPAGVIGLEAAAVAGGKVRLAWRWRPDVLGVLPQAFRIFGDGGTGTIDDESPLGEVAWEDGRRVYTWASDPLADGTEHRLAVRAVAAGDVRDEAPPVVTATPDATPPAQVDALEAEVTP